MKILALDPGGTTGVAYYNDEHGIRTWKREEVVGNDHHFTLMNLLNRYDFDVLIYERFNYQRREIDKGISVSLISCEYIGVIKFWHQTVSRIPEAHEIQLVAQQPSCMQFWTNEFLDRINLDMPGSEHMRDATRHILYYLMHTQKDMHYVHMLKKD